ncbi:MAG: cardiolipin synthase [Rhodocyclaceae bacterium]|nr:cardiolipin synthase [Rhodocyclaceae bacterium]
MNGDNWLIIFSVSAYALAIPSAVRAVLVTRTSQGAMGWVIALMAMPVISLPLYWVFGRTKFQGYVNRRAQIDELAVREAERLRALRHFDLEPRAGLQGLHGIASKLSGTGFLGGNCLELLVGGKATFDSILAEIAAAERYILVQYYIFRADGVGRRFAAALMARAKAGVKVSFLFDPIGSSLPRSFIEELRRAGIRCSPFDTTRGKGNRFQINFRNHRKIVVVDGRVGFIGGLNVGDDYLGLDPDVGRWRDAHVRIQGPAAVMAAVAFVKDWYWARRKLPRMDFDLPDACGDSRVLLWHTGPADDQPECTVSLLSSFNAARKRIWIANPYFVPTDPVQQALRLAILRGVDVRIVLPEKGDNRLIRQASWLYQADLLRAGGRVFHYCAGFLHTKAFVVDDLLACVGTVNLDHRSILINFEIAAFSDDERFVRSVGRMLDDDFAESREISIAEVNRRSIWHRFATRAANMLAPIL